MRRKDMEQNLTPAQKATLTRRRAAADQVEAEKVKWQNAAREGQRHERESKKELKKWGKANGWRVAFFDSPSGSPLTGIIDAIAFRLNAKDRDVLEILLYQLKSGKAGPSGHEVGRLKEAIRRHTIEFRLAEFDGRVLHQQREVSTV
jgi:hypothetical protein